jgi:hypothetical protein
MNTFVLDSSFTALLWLWAPRALAAFVIMVVAYFVGGFLKSLVATAVNRLPVLAKHSEGLAPQRTAGANVGEVVFWLVLLVGVVAALNALQLPQVAGPLNALLNRVMSFVPNIIGAGLILFVGYIVATIVKKLVTAALVASNADRVFAGLGLNSKSSSSPGDHAASLSQAAGTLVFVLILIPVVISALQTLNIQAISAPAIVVLSTILSAIPNVLAAAIVLTLGFLIGRWASKLVEGLLATTGIDRALGSLGALTSFGAKGGQATPSPAASGGMAPTKLIAGFVMVAITVFSAIEAAQLLHFAGLALVLAAVLSLAGRVIVGGAIIALGSLVADVLSNLIGRAPGQDNRFAASVVRWTAIALALAMGLKFMGIADEIVVLAFGLTLGSAAIAAALAFGLGGRDAAARLANDWASKALSPKQPVVAPQAQSVEDPSNP